MALFFTQWELWEDLTFVLGCAIVLVFIFGLAKSWWAGRLQHRLELVDSQQRSQADVENRNVHIPSVSEIPFGVRAIESGVEVQGIWISRPNTPQAGQSATSLSTVSEGGSSLAQPGSSITGDNATKASQPARLSRSMATRRVAGRSTPPISDESTAFDVPFSSTSNALTQSSTPRCVVDGIASQDLCNSPSQEISTDLKARDMIQAGKSLTTASAMDQHPSYGLADVYANREMRKPNDQFEVLPAGILGARIELMPQPNSQRMSKHQTKTNGKKLRKSFAAASTNHNPSIHVLTTTTSTNLPCSFSH